MEEILGVNPHRQGAAARLAVAAKALAVSYPRLRFENVD